MFKKSKKLVISQDFENDSLIFDSCLEIQNNINIYADSKVVCVVSPKNQKETNIISYFLALTYAKNNEKTIIIDCNLYKNLLMENISYVQKHNNINDVLDIDDKSKVIMNLRENLDIIFSSPYEYPTKILKSTQFSSLLKTIKCRYEHVILVMPNLCEHQDILLCKANITSTLLVAVKDKTSREDLFNCVEFIKKYELPFVGTIYIK